MHNGDDVKYYLKKAARLSELKRIRSSWPCVRISIWRMPAKAYRDKAQVKEMGVVRLILAVSVVLEHADNWGLSGSSFVAKLLPGNMAVEMFFIISGFYMSLILTRKYNTQTASGIYIFYVNRFVRLWPIFLLTTALIEVLWVVSYIYKGRGTTSAGPFHDLINNEFAWSLLQFSNIFMIGQDIPSVFHVSPVAGLRLTFGPPVTLLDGSLWLGYALNITQAWSIGAEIWFYLLAPLLIRLPSWALAVALMASLALRAHMGLGLGLNVYFFFPTQLCMFLAGVLAQRYGAEGITLRKESATLCLVSVIVATLAFGSIGHLDQGYKWALYAIFSLTMSGLFQVTKGFRADRAVGELSYPVYIIHALVLSILSIIFHRLELTVNSEFLLLCVLITAYLLYIYVEIPVSRYRERIAVRRLLLTS